MVGVPIDRTWQKKVEFRLTGDGGTPFRCPAAAPSNSRLMQIERNLAQIEEVCQGAPATAVPFSRSAMPSFDTRSTWLISSGSSRGVPHIFTTTLLSCGIV